MLSKKNFKFSIITGNVKNRSEQIERFQNDSDVLVNVFEKNTVRVRKATKSMNENKELIMNNGYLTNLNLENNLSNELAGLDSGFDHIKIPVGGSLNFEISNLENSDEPIFTKEFAEVILYHHFLFTYYKNKYNGSSNPLYYCSFDGVIGTETPGGNCRYCKLNAFGSGENVSKICKNKHRRYLLRENEIFSNVLILPAALYKNSKYIKRLLSLGKRSDSVVTKLFLKKTVNKAGISFSKVHFSFQRCLE